MINYYNAYVIINDYFILSHINTSDIIYGIFKSYLTSFTITYDYMLTACVIIDDYLLYCICNHIWLPPTQSYMIPMDYLLHSLLQHLIRVCLFTVNSRFPDLYPTDYLLHFWNSHTLDFLQVDYFSSSLYSYSKADYSWTLGGYEREDEREPNYRGILRIIINWNIDIFEIL